MNKPGFTRINWVSTRLYRIIEKGLRLPWNNIIIEKHAKKVGSYIRYEV